MKHRSAQKISLQLALLSSVSLFACSLPEGFPGLPGATPSAQPSTQPSSPPASGNSANAPAQQRPGTTPSEPGATGIPPAPDPGGDSGTGHGCPPEYPRCAGTNPSGKPPIPPVPSGKPVSNQDYPPITTVPDQPVATEMLPAIQGKIAYLSTRDQAIVSRAYTDLSLYLYQNRESRRLSTDRLPLTMDLNHKFISAGSQIAYFGSETGPQDIALYTQPLDFRNLTAGGEPVRNRLNTTSNAVFSPLPGEYSRWDLSAGNLLAVAIQTADLKADIWVGKADGGGLVNLTREPDLYYGLQWSPNGKKLAYVQLNPNGQPGQNIFVVSANGQDKIRLTPDGQNFEPQWSPDGSKILFTSQRGNLMHLYVVNADGSNLQQLTQGEQNDYRGKWSPDGSKIIYTSDKLAMTTHNLNGEEIFVVNADGSKPQQLTNNGFQDTDPVWSPDGSQIAFASNRDGNFEIYIAQADGSRPINLSRNKAADTHPVWSR